MSEAAPKPSGWFRRFFLPGFAFKAVIIGGGYATGRELAEFFLPSGPWGGILGMAVSALVWSGVCALTFLLARRTHSLDYRAFFRRLLGPAWFLFEIIYVALMIVGLAVFGAAAGAIGAALFGAPPIVGTLLLVVLIGGFAAFGNETVEGLFKYVSFILYGVYALLLIFGLSAFGDKVAAAFAHFTPGPGWAAGGLTYAGYNLIGAVAVLPIVRHMGSDRDAVTAGLLAGPLAMTPAIFFFVCMAAWPDIAQATLPSDFLLGKLHLPIFRLLYQGMIFAALLESGTGVVHAVNERIAGSLRERAYFDWRWRLAAVLAMLTGSVFLAQEFGLVGLIAGGYRWLSYGFLAVYVAPLLTIGVWIIAKRAKA